MNTEPRQHRAFPSSQALAGNCRDGTPPPSRLFLSHEVTDDTER